MTCGGYYVSKRKGALVRDKIGRDGCEKIANQEVDEEI